MKKVFPRSFILCLIYVTYFLIFIFFQTGVLLLSQLLHLEKVERLKCRTYAPPRFLGLAETVSLI